MREVDRKFVDSEAKRERVPLLIALNGPSSSGKTRSALRLASGIQRVVGGEIFGCDSESRRMLAYADKHKFRHVPFGAPFSSLDYKALLEHCAARGAKTVVVDSMSHEHEGQGGYLEYHEREMERLGGGDAAKAERAQITAWGRPAAERRALLNAMQQLGLNLILCFRAKEKIKPRTGQAPIIMGFQPIGGDEYVYEMSTSFLLYPLCKGVPTLNSQLPGERLIIKLPEQFEHLFKGANTQLSEQIGHDMADWSKGDAPVEEKKKDGDTPPAANMPTVAGLSDHYAACSDMATFRVLEEKREALWPTIKGFDRTALKQAADLALRRIEDAAAMAGAPEQAGLGLGGGKNA